MHSLSLGKVSSKSEIWPVPLFFDFAWFSRGHTLNLFPGENAPDSLRPLQTVEPSQFMSNRPNLDAVVPIFLENPKSRINYRRTDKLSQANEQRNWIFFYAIVIFAIR